MDTVKNKVCLVVIDGWGNAPDTPYNAVTNANTPVMDALSQGPLVTEVAAHGLAVGLPDGVMGNSEVGHLTIGGGRINFQDLERINFSIKDKTLNTNQRLLDLFSHVKSTNGRLHLCGLVSDGGVHSHIEHLKVLLAIAKEHEIPECYIHCFTDGRDTKPASGLGYIKELQAYLDTLGFGKIASVVGRYYAMDRDKRWERIEIAYNAMVESKGATIVNSIDELYATIDAKYAAGETDEFFKPIIVHYPQLVPTLPQSTQDTITAVNALPTNILPRDSMLFFNYRSDRMREIVSCFGTDVKPFENETTVIRDDLYVVQFTRYDSRLDLPVVFPPLDMRDSLGEWVSKKGVSQLHVAETEKYAHVTFFFNGGIEEAFVNEDRKLVSSPSVPTYDLKPEMSAHEVGVACAEGISSEKYALVIVNFAPPDMVGHTGVYEAAVKSAEATDKAIGIIKDACEKHGYVLAVTADHGNCEQMISDDGKTPHTAHTSNPVPFYIHFPSSSPHKERASDYKSLLPGGGLQDVAPTMLDLLGFDVPSVMTGKSLLIASSQQ